MIKKSRIFLRGLNYFGQFGFETDLDYNKSFIEYKDLYNIEIKKIDCNLSQSYYLIDGNIYLNGWNFDYPQSWRIYRFHKKMPDLMNFFRNYNIFDLKSHNTFKLLNNEENIIDFILIGSGLYFYNREHLFSLGDNLRKQLSHETSIILNPEMIIDHRINVDDILEISGNDQHSIILLNNGLTLASGATNSFQYIPKDLIRENVENHKQKYEYILSELEISGEKIIKISCGYSHSVFLTNSNKLFVCGNNRFNQCGVIYPLVDFFKKYYKLDLNLDANEFIIDLKSGNSHNIILTNKNRLFFFGSNKNNQIPKKINHYNMEFSANFEIKLDFLEQNEKIVKIFTKYNQTAIITNLKRSFIWGDYIDGIENLGFEGKILDIALGFKHLIVKTEL